MKKTPLLTQALQMAQSLSRHYAKLEVASTQNVRNPLPLRELVQIVLPTFLDISTPIPVVKTVKFTFKGKQYVKHITGTEMAENLLPAETFYGDGKTASQVTQDLVAMGYIVNPASVSQTLCSLRSQGKIFGYADDTAAEYGRPPTAYCILEK